MTASAVKGKADKPGPDQAGLEKLPKAKLEGRARDTASKIAEVLKQRFQEQGWIK